MAQTLIRWRLNEVMARHRIKGGDLAEFMGVSDNAISNLRKARTMPRIDGERLNQLCNGLNELAKAPDRIITPTDLIEYTFDSGEGSNN